MHSEAIAVHRDLLHVVLALDAHALLGDEVLHDDVGHGVAVRVPLLVQAVDGGEDELVHRDGAGVAADSDVVLLRARLRAPHPVLALGDGDELHAVLGHQRRLLVTATHHQVLAVGEEGQRARVEVQAAVLAVLQAAQLVERQGLVPAPQRQHLRRLLARWVPRHAPDGRVADNGDLLHAVLVTHRHVAVQHAQGQELPVVRPRGAQDLGRHLVLLHGLLLRRPQTEVGRGAGGKLLCDRVVHQLLDGVVVAVLQDTLRLVCPDDDGLVRSTRREALAISRVVYAVH